MAVTRTVADAFTSVVRDRGPAPLVTWYDGTTGERVELSAATAATWVTKVANLVTDELMLDPGAGVRLDLPPHWQTIVTALGCWTAGAHLTSGGAELAVVGPQAVRKPDAVDAEHVLASALQPLGGAFDEPLPSGWLDFAAEVPPQPDAIVAPVDVSADDAAVVAAGQTLTHADLSSQLRTLAQEVGWQRDTRCLLLGDLRTLDEASRFDVLCTSLLPVVVGGSIVLGHRLDEEACAQVVDTEGVTLTLVV